MKKNHTNKRHRGALASVCLFAFLCSFLLSSCTSTSATVSDTNALFDQSNLDGFVKTLNDEAKKQGVSAEYLLTDYETYTPENDTEREYCLSDALTFSTSYGDEYLEEQQINLFMISDATRNDETVMFQYLNALFTIFEPNEEIQQDINTLLTQSDDCMEHMLGTNCVFHVFNMCDQIGICINPLSIEEMLVSPPEKTDNTNLFASAPTFAGIHYADFIDRLNTESKAQGIEESYLLDDYVDADIAYEFYTDANTSITLIFDYDNMGSQALKIIGLCNNQALTPTQEKYCAAVFATLEPNHETETAQFMERILTPEQTEYPNDIYFGPTAWYSLKVTDKSFQLWVLPYSDFSF